MNYKTDCLQYKPEHDRLIELLKDADVQSYLEIGSSFGGTLWRVANILPKGSRIVSVDFPGKLKGVPTIDSLKACVEELRSLGYDIHLILGDSTRHDVVSAVAKLAPFDAVFLDGNHQKEYVKVDWANYGQMATKIFAFHDITRTLIRPGKYPIEVSEIWNEIKGNYSHEEIKLDPCDMIDGVGMHNGIGVLKLEDVET